MRETIGEVTNKMIRKMKNDRLMLKDASKG